MKLSLLVFSLGIANSLAQPTVDGEQQLATRMKWFNEARFGLFIHWGLYAVAGGEWNGKPVPSAGEWIQETAKIPTSEYKKLLPQFNPVKFNAETWVRIATNAGMKYIVITSKHHDGFALFDSKLTDWDIMSSPFKRDVLKELADACAAADIRLCFYHSIMDWYHPDWGTRRPWNDRATSEPNMDRYITFLKGQLKELLTGYGPLGIMWFDGEWENAWTHERGVDLYNYVRALQPDIIINNRVGKGRAGMAGMDQGDKRVGDYGTPEQEIPPTGFGPGVYWESCMTMNNTWGFKKDDKDWKTASVLIRNLIDCAAKGGNYLLNVGPTAEGVIPEASVERLAEIGRWMKVNSEAIYGTSAGPFKTLPFEGRCTSKGNKLFLHVFTWPSEGLKLQGLQRGVVAARAFEGDQKLMTTSLRDNSGLHHVTIERPQSVDPVATVIELSLE